MIVLLLKFLTFITFGQFDRIRLEDIVFVVLAGMAIVAIITLTVGFYLLQCSVGKSILMKWSQDHGFKILSFRRVYFLSGPFNVFNTSKSQTVFMVTVRGSDGFVQSGLVRCGSYVGGVFFSNKVDVKWNK
jgi:hypothetical protein